jgi:hypothetical protein
MLQHKWTWYLSIFVFAILINACGGGSSSDIEPNDSSGEGEINDDDETSPHHR